MATQPTVTVEDQSEAPPVDTHQKMIKTYWYLRLALVAMVVLLLVAIVREWWGTGWTCVQTSISAYYYTPAQMVFAGTLIVIGVCLIVLKGNTPTEDTLLNIAGMLSPVVAFVPTPKWSGDCTSVPVVLRPSSAAAGADAMQTHNLTNDMFSHNVENNMFAYMVLGVIVLTVISIDIFQRRGKPTGSPKSALVGLLVVWAVTGAAVIFLIRGLHTFLGWAHYLAAVPMFIILFAVVWMNGRRVHKAQNSPANSPWRGRASNPYTVIGWVMVVATIGCGLSAWAGFEYWVLCIELGLILPFAAFWGFQTFEFKDTGLGTTQFVDVARKS